jgi:hypothetical protein
VDVHKGIGNPHGADDHDVHEERHDDNALIESNKGVVLGETVADEVGFDSLEKVPVEAGVEYQVEKLLNSILVLVDEFVCRVDLEASWDPDVEDAKIDCYDEDGGGDHDMP